MMIAETEEKVKRLTGAMAGYPRKVAVAFSGGVDSAFLLSVASEILGDDLFAVTVNAGFVPRRDIDHAGSVAEALCVSHEMIYVDFNRIDNFTDNPTDRCYYCKRAIFSGLKEFAAKRGAETVIEATNADDLEDYRPGIRALSELDVKSPLIEARFSKNEIRKLSKERDVPGWDRPSDACLATRIETGQQVTATKLEQIEEAENYLKSLGFALCRVRHHGALARIEVSPDKIDDILSSSVRQGIDKRFRELGFIYVTVDMEGYKRGSMNKELNHRK